MILAVVFVPGREAKRKWVAVLWAAFFGLWVLVGGPCGELGVEEGLSDFLVRL